MNVQNEKTCLDYFRCLCCKKKEKTIRKYSEARIDVTANKTLHEKRHARLESGENILISEALAWNGHYTIKESTNNSKPINLIMANFEPPK